LLLLLLSWILRVTSYRLSTWISRPTRATLVRSTPGSWRQRGIGALTKLILLFGITSSFSPAGLRSAGDRRGYQSRCCLWIARLLRRVSRLRRLAILCGGLLLLVRISLSWGKLLVWVLLVRVYIWSARWRR
jgi:hypothetical protein